MTGSDFDWMVSNHAAWGWKAPVKASVSGVSPLHLSPFFASIFPFFSPFPQKRLILRLEPPRIKLCWAPPPGCEHEISDKTISALKPLFYCLTSFQWFWDVKIAQSDDYSREFLHVQNICWVSFPDDCTGNRGHFNEKKECRAQKNAPSIRFNPSRQTIRNQRQSISL